MGASLEPYAEDKVAYNSGKLFVEVTEMLLGDAGAVTGTMAMATTASAGMALAPVSGPVAPVTIGATAQTIAAEAAFTTASVAMAVASEQRAGNTLNDLLNSKADIVLPEQEAQLKHIFRDKEGHLTDTPENRQLVLDVAIDSDNYIGTDERGNVWYAVNNEDGTQTWVRVRNGKVDNAGVNSVPREWNPETGLYNNIRKKK